MALSAKLSHFKLCTIWGIFELLPDIESIAIDLDFLPCDLIINRVILLSRVNNCAKFSNSHISWSTVWSEHYLYKDQMFDLDH